MADAPRLSIILSYRNRDAQRVRRCLDSLANQTIKDFEVLFVDFGSDSAAARTIKALVEQYPFARYFYSDTRGQPWNRSIALNIGIQNAAGPYILTADVDLILSPTVLEISLQHASPKRVLHLRPFMLPQDFADWQNVTQYEERFPLGPVSMLGVFQLAAADHWRALRGFDEFYRYYGVEDRDLGQRLAQLGVETHWLTGIVPTFHQWHPPANYLIQGFMPDQVWTRMSLHYYKHFAVLERNQASAWGQMVSTEDRAVFAYVDPEQNRLLESERLHHFRENPLSTQGVATLIRSFFELPVGHALAVHHADTPQSLPLVDMLIALGDRLLKRRQSKARLGYRPNLVYDALHHLIEQTPEHIADYYLDANGVSIVVKAQYAGNEPRR